MSAGYKPRNRFVLIGDHAATCVWVPFARRMLRRWGLRATYTKRRYELPEVTLYFNITPEVNRVIIKAKPVGEGCGFIFKAIPE